MGLNEKTWYLYVETWLKLPKRWKGSDNHDYLFILVLFPYRENIYMIGLLDHNMVGSSSKCYMAYTILTLEVI